MTSARQRRRTGPSLPRAIGVNDNAPAIANDNAPCLIMLGDLPLISRHPIDRLSPGELARVNRIEAALRGRNTREAARLALDYEASQGITPEERCAVMNPANDLDRAVEMALGFAVTAYAQAYVPPPPPKKAKRPKGVKKPKEPKPDPLEGLKPGDLTQDEIDRLTTADQNLKSPDMAVRKKATQTILSIQRAARNRLMKSELGQRRREIVALEALRGNRVEIPKSETAAIEVPGRDGLETIPLPPSLRSAARQYRDDYEQINPEGKLTPPDPTQAGRAPHGGGEGWEEKRAEIIERLWATHLMIAGAQPGPDGHSAMPILPASHPAMLAIYALEEIAGKGANLRDLTSSGSMRAKLSKAFVRALGCAAVVYGVPGHEGPASKPKKALKESGPPRPRQPTWFRGAEFGT